MRTVFRMKTSLGSDMGYISGSELVDYIKEGNIEDGDTFEAVVEEGTCCICETPVMMGQHICPDCK